MAKIQYQAHCGGIGWQQNVVDGQIAGTVGLSVPLEAFRITGLNVSNLGVHAFAHVQDFGWSGGNIINEDVGTTGLCKHIEAIKIGLIGDEAPNYDIWYRCHVRNYGWFNWSKNGEVNGTEGGNLQVEAIQIELHEKNEGFSPRVDYNGQYIDLTPKVDKREIVLNAARSWLGYLAEENNAFGVDNYCIAFVCDCMASAGIDFINTAWCDDAKYWAQDKGIWIGDPYAGQSGFPISFDWDENGVENHFGLVESVVEPGVYNTIEANTSGPNGIGIYRKVRTVAEDDISGFINPY